MKAIIIGAGRGSRLRDLTTDIPKTLVEVMDRPMLDAILEALEEGGFTRRDIVFITGYCGDVVKERYPDLTFVDNDDWPNNNILGSLLYAREHMADGFVATYADIVYRGQIVKDLVASPHDLAMGCDTDWRRRYVRRTEHPEHDAEKLRAEGDRITEISRTIASEQAHGEFVGVWKASPRGTERFLAAYDKAKAKYEGGMFREGRTFAKAYLIDLFAEMLEAGETMHNVDTDGGYMEIDTQQDRAFAASWWAGGS